MDWDNNVPSHVNSNKRVKASKIYICLNMQLQLNIIIEIKRIRYKFRYAGNHVREIFT